MHDVFRRLRTVLLVLAVTLTSASVLTASVAQAKKAPRYKQGRWSGIAEPGNAKFTFTVHGTKLSKFVVPSVGCFAITGEQVTSFAMTRATSIAHNGRFSESNANTDTVKGRFKGRSAASGTFSQKKGCDLGENWKARPGKTPPPPPKAPTPPGCSVGHPCKATDGLRIQVTGTDTTLTSVQNPNCGPYSDTVDHAYDPPPTGTGGGVLVTFTATNTTSSPITITTSGGEWTLQDGAGGHDASRDETDKDMTTTDGAIATDSTTCSDQSVTVAPGQTSPTESLCFAVPAADRHNLRLLFDYPSTMGNVPLD